MKKGKNKKEYVAACIIVIQKLILYTIFISMDKFLIFVEKTR